jgi:hypothetical protein
MPPQSTKPAVSPAIVVHALKLLYVPVAKAACSSVKFALLGPLGIKPPDPWWKIHSVDFPTVTPAECRELQAHRYDCFTVVRHPLDRLYSCWVSKFHPDRFRDLEQHHDVLRLGMSFPEFVAALEGIDLRTANEHIRPQSVILAPGRAKVLSFENVNRDWWQLRLSHPLLPELPMVNVSEHPDWRTAYSPELVERAVALYAGDLFAFGYKRGGDAWGAST